MSDDNWRPGPDVERAFSFEIAFCGDPNCGLHLVPRRQDGSAICEVVMSIPQTLGLVEICHDHLYEKAVKRT